MEGIFPKFDRVYVQKHLPFEEDCEVFHHCANHIFDTYNTYTITEISRNNFGRLRPKKSVPVPVPVSRDSIRSVNIGSG